MNTQQELIKVFTELTDLREMELFIREILTPNEFNDLILRWRLLKDLHQGHTQRNIATSHHISLCKITRGSKILKQKNSITKKILDTYYGGKD